MSLKRRSPLIENHTLSFPHTSIQHTALTLFNILSPHREIQDYCLKIYYSAAMKRILLVEDDQDIVNLLSLHLNDMHYEVSKATDGISGLKLALSQSFDLILLDIMLPGLDGIEICRQIRAKEILTPVIMLTARTEEIDKVIGLETGADDYITKPFSLREVMARVKAHLRRADLISKLQEYPNFKNLSFEGLEIDEEKRAVKVEGLRVELTPKEFDLLMLLASHPGRSYSRDKLLELVWGYEFNGYEHTVNSHINRLRSKIEKDVSSPRYILTTWGVGYRFAEY